MNLPLWRLAGLRRSLVAPLALAAAMVFVTTSAWAEEPSVEPTIEPSVDAVRDAATSPTAEVIDPRWILTNDLRFRIEPLGVVIDSSLKRRNVYRRDGSLLFDGVYWEAGANLAITPALAEVGPHFEWMPMRIFILRAEYRLLTSFGLLGYTMSFPEASSPYGDDEVDAREGEEEAGIGHRLMISPTLQLAVGPLIIRNVTEFIYHRFDGFDGPYVRERLYDQLNASDGDAMVVNTSVLAFRGWDGPGDAMWIIGPFFEYVTTFNAGTQRQRVGGVTVFIPDDAWGNFHRPRVYLQAGSNLQDRNREGSFFIQGGVGFDLWFL